MRVEKGLSTAQLPNKTSHLESPAIWNCLHQPNVRPKTTPGEICPHVPELSLKARKMVHGVQGDYEEAGVSGCFASRKMHPLLQELAERREDLYRSPTGIFRRPERQNLGEPVSHGIKLPEYTKSPGFAFGEVKREDVDAKTIIYPSIQPIPKEDQQKFHRQYVISHQSYGLGEHRSPYGPDWHPPRQGEIAESIRAVNSRYNFDGHRARASMNWVREPAWRIFRRGKVGAGSS